MKVYKQIMNVVTILEDLVLVLSSVLVVVLTFGNVVARKVFHHSWGFTEEIVIAVFVLISLLAAGVAAKKGELINLALIPDNVGPKAKKVLNVISNIICLAYSLILTYQGWGRMQVEKTFSPILHIPKMIFWSFVLVGGISLALHFIENCIDFCSADLSKEEE